MKGYQHFLVWKVLLLPLSQAGQKLRNSPRGRIKLCFSRLVWTVKDEWNYHGHLGSENRESRRQTPSGVRETHGCYRMM
jgi:hypothetical protein